MPTPTLIKQVLSGPNGTRIYEYVGRYYAVDGEIDCRDKNAGEELIAKAWANERNLKDLERKVNRATGR
jgi:hypothetical protein